MVQEDGSNNQGDGGLSRFLWIVSSFKTHLKMNVAAIVVAHLFLSENSSLVRRLKLQRIFESEINW